MSDMDCDGLRKVLFDHVDGLLGGGEADAAREHLAACGPCRALQEEVRRNFSALDAWEEEELPAGAFARLQARIPAGPTPVHEIGTAPAGTRRRGWLRGAVPHGAGIAPAAAATWLLVLPPVAGNGRGAPPTPPVPAAAAGTALLALTGARVPVSAQDAAPGGTNLEGLEREVRAILARCDSAVVRVEGERVARFGVVARTVEARLALEERLRAFGPRESVSAAGFLAEEEGLVLTTSAASTGAGAIRVTFPRGALRGGKLLGEDLLAGVALVRVDPVEGTRALRLSAAEPGRGAVSLLLAPRGEEPPTIHLGFVTATGRPFGNYDGWLVSSVPLTAGHAGAPLLDARGGGMGMAVAPRGSGTHRTLTPAPDPGPPPPGRG